MTEHTLNSSESKGLRKNNNQNVITQFQILSLCIHIGTVELNK